MYLYIERERIRETEKQKESTERYCVSLINVLLVIYFKCWIFGCDKRYK